MFLVDTVEGRIIDDQELKQSYAARQPYGDWLKENMVRIEDLPMPSQIHGLEEKTLVDRQRVFGTPLKT